MERAGAGAGPGLVHTLRKIAPDDFVEDNVESTPVDRTGRAAGPSPLSCVVVTYNSAGDIDGCLEALLAQTEPPAEVVVVDNASHDDTVARLRARRDPRIRVVALERNVGFAAGCNRGVAESTGERVLLLNPDCRPEPTALAALRAFDEEDPGRGIVGGRSRRPDGSPSLDSAWGQPSVWSLLCFGTLLSTAFAGSGTFDPESLGRWQRDTPAEVGVVTGLLLHARRATWDRLGGFDEDFFMYGEDIDLSFRAREAGLRPSITPAAVVVHEGGASSSSSSDKLVLLLSGKVTLVRKRWRGPRRAAGLALLQLGVALRALLGVVSERLTGRAPRSAWRAAWARRREWRRGYALRPARPQPGLPRAPAG